jgi:hypothetical protein
MIRRMRAAQRFVNTVRMTAVVTTFANLWWRST